MKQGHDIGREIKNEILNRFPDVGEVLIHVSPYYIEPNQK
ncbi:cation transporter dimerization domain-containing protein [Lysinibacillus sp. RC79]